MANPVMEIRKLLIEKMETILHRFNTDIIFFKYPILYFHDGYLKITAAILDKAVVHVIGDSHIKSYIFEAPFIIHHIEQATAYNLGKNDSTTKSKARLEKILRHIDKKRDILIMVFGEIDARIHIYYQYEKNRKKIRIEELIDETIKKYSDILRNLIGAGYTIAVYGIPPATSIEINHFRYPYYGTPLQRSEISRQFNTRLREYCSRNKIPYIDVYSVSANKEGFIKKGFAEDDIHLNKRIVPFTRQQLATYFGNRRRFLSDTVDKPAG